ncbi:MAG: hypothetical protein IPJ19_14420 [Planctomycetes bacterium]|nr:hypothetical protein [Planctomycetota bacterium]
MRAASPSVPDSARAELPRQLGLALGFGLLGALGCLPGAHGPDPLAELAWVAIVALPCGIGCGALGLRAWPFAASVPALWMIALALAGAASERTLGTPLWAALCWTGIFAAGWGLGRASGSGARLAAAGLCVATLLALLPSLGGFLGRPWPARAAARLLDLSPLSICMESAGVDWLRHPAVYEPAGALDIDPGLRQPWRGKLAGPALLLLGCALAAFGAVRARARERAPA